MVASCRLAGAGSLTNGLSVRSINGSSILINNPEAAGQNAFDNSGPNRAASPVRCMAAKRHLAGVSGQQREIRRGQAIYGAVEQHVQGEAAHNQC